jgi:hypothetical protein
MTLYFLSQVVQYKVQSWPVKEHRTYHFETWYMYASALICIDSLYRFTLKKIFCLFYKAI